MNAQSIAVCLSSTLQTSHRLLTALLCHCPALFPDTILQPYVPPLTSGSQLPDDPVLMEQELTKQESLLSQIHEEMNTGIVLKKREELLWEVQRIITQLKVSFVLKFFIFKVHYLFVCLYPGSHLLNLKKYFLKIQIWNLFGLQIGSAQILRSLLAFTAELIINRFTCFWRGYCFDGNSLLFI